MTKNYSMPRILILFAIITLLYACKKSNDGTDPNKQYLLSKVYENGRLMKSFDYNNQYQLANSMQLIPTSRKTFNIIEMSYHYNSEGRLIRTDNTHKSYLGMITNTSTVYEYDTEGRLIAEKPSNYNPNLKSMVEYSYTGNTITKTQWADGAIYIVYIFTMDDKGNVVKAETDFRAFNDYTKAEWFDYDNKKNANGPYTGVGASINNPGRLVFTPRNASRQTTKYIYKYNNAGYVTKRWNTANDDVLTYEYIPVN